MLTREQNWQREEEQQYETARITDPDENSKYYEELERYGERFNCEAFDCKVIYAYTNELQYKKKATLRSEVLHLVCQIEDTNSYIEVSIFGRTRAFNEERKEWGEWGKNGNALNDVMEIIARQKTNYLESYHLELSFDIRDVYPHICGTRLKVLASVVELKTSSKGKLYDKNVFAVFDPKGFSGWELKMGLTDRMDYRKTFDGFKESYLHFCEEQGIEPRQFGSKKVEAPKEEVKAVQEEPQRIVNSMNAFTGMTEPEYSDDDLPF